MKEEGALRTYKAFSDVLLQLVDEAVSSRLWRKKDRRTKEEVKEVNASAVTAGNGAPG